MSELSEAKRILKMAKVTFYKTVARTFPVDSQQIYTHGSNLVQCIVLRHAFDRIKVTGLMSGKEYWVDVYRFIE